MGEIITSGDCLAHRGGSKGYERNHIDYAESRMNTPLMFAKIKDIDCPAGQLARGLGAKQGPHAAMVPRIHMNVEQIVGTHRLGQTFKDVSSASFTDVHDTLKTGVFHRKMMARRGHRNTLADGTLPGDLRHCCANWYPDGMFAGLFDGPEVIVVLVVILVLFGGSQIPKLARNLGQAQKEFKKGLNDGSKDGETPSSDET